MKRRHKEVKRGKKATKQRQTKQESEGRTKVTALEQRLKKEILATEQKTRVYKHCHDIQAV